MGDVSGARARGWDVGGPFMVGNEVAGARVPYGQMERGGGGGWVFAGAVLSSEGPRCHRIRSGR